MAKRRKARKSSAPRCVKVRGGRCQINKGKRKGRFCRCPR